ncbi:MAG: hypothetical protein RL065_2 [Bacteroidota bacterium]|jgi:PKD repeat protein
MKFKILISAFLILCILLLNYDYSLTNSLAPPTQKTGSALSSGTCSSCHGGGGGSGSIGYVFYYQGTTVQASSYVPGCTYDIQVNVSGTGNSSPRYGFEMDAVDASNVGAGTFTLTHPSSDPIRTQVNTLGANGACEVSHKNANSTSTWSFQWTAPATNVGNINFSLVGVYGDGAGSNGDDVATASFFLPASSVAPVANFHILPNDTVCVGTQVTFVDSATNNGSVIIGAGYNFGTGQGNSGVFTSVQPTVNKTYTTAGTYQVVYTLSTVNPITNMPCTYSTKIKTITVINYPDASFHATVKPGCPGGRDTLQLNNPNASVTYTPSYSTATALTPLSAQGPYPITLPNSLGNVIFSMTATGFGCTSPVYKDTVQIQSCSNPAALFSVDSLNTNLTPSRYCHNTLFTIHDHSNTSGGNIIDWQWKLTGVGGINPIPSSFNGQGPFNVQFPITGFYNVKLIVTDSRGLIDSTTSLVTINGCGPNVLHAIFVSQPTAAVSTGLNTSSLKTCINDTLNYVDNSTGVITGYRWVWGDGTPDGNSVSEFHAYSTSGNFTMLYIIDSAGVKFDSMTTLITVGTVSNAFAGIDTALCPSNLGVTLGSSAAAGMTYAWTTSNSNFVPAVSNPSVMPTSTTSYYLKVSNATNTCFSFDTVVVLVDTIPTMNIIASNTTVCFNNQIVVNTSAPNLKNYVFSFGSGYSSTGSGAGPYLVSWGQPGFKCISATAKTIKAGCNVSSTAMNPCVQVSNCFAPIASFISPVGPNCSGNSILFTDASQNSPTNWSWRFISPDTLNHPAIPALSSNQNPTITAQIAGKYYITLQTSNSGGTSATYLDSIEVFETPIADFNLIDTICVSHNTIIIYSGNAKPTATYTWSFNPAPTATTGGNQGPVYANWSTVGSKSVNLQVTENGCPSVVVSKNLIVTPLPIANFIYNNIGPNYSFVNQSSGTPSSFFWSFGDGQTSTTQHPIHSYTSNGYFLVTLTVSKNGCSDDDTISIKAIVNGIDDANENKLFNAFHNNSNSTLNINLLDGFSNDLTIEIINVNGQVIYSENHKSGKNISISTSNFAKGIYAVRCTNELGNTAIKKWMKD